MSILYIIFSIRGNVSPKLHSNVSWQVCIFTIYYFFMWTDLSIVKKKQMIINFNHVSMATLINTQYCYERFKIAAMKNPISNDFQLLFCNGKEKEPPTAS
ncbi:hypothetical protein T09_6936 [Trichinella sp. T9]|nr:hypothetical protein T09_6936 [Trichinella sp. T9]KRZ91429.1 hypothetical protein T08_7831 [Trichinella sp. T8]